MTLKGLRGRDLRISKRCSTISSGSVSRTRADDVDYHMLYSMNLTPMTRRTSIGSYSNLYVGYLLGRVSLLDERGGLKGVIEHGHLTHFFFDCVRRAKIHIFLLNSEYSKPFELWDKTHRQITTLSPYTTVAPTILSVGF